MATQYGNIGYEITLGSATVQNPPSEKDANADLIALTNTIDTQQAVSSMDIVLGNKNKKYNLKFFRGEQCAVKLHLLDNDGNALKEHYMFSGIIEVVDWSYDLCHIIAKGADAEFCDETPATRRVYSNVTNIDLWLAIIKDLIKDYNKAVVYAPIEEDIICNITTSSTDQSFEVPRGQPIEDTMDKIMTKIGGTYHIDIINGKNYLVISGATPADVTHYIADPKLHQHLILDNDAQNGIAYITEATVIGSPYEIDSGHDMNLHKTTAPHATAIIKGADTIRHVTHVDLNCHTVFDCIAKAESIVRQALSNKNTVTPTFTNICPPVGAMFTYQDPNYGWSVTGNVVSRELRISASEGWVCTIGLGLVYEKNIEVLPIDTTES